MPTRKDNTTGGDPGGESGGDTGGIETGGIGTGPLRPDDAAPPLSDRTEPPAAAPEASAPETVAVAGLGSGDPRVGDTGASYPGASYPGARDPEAAGASPAQETHPEEHEEEGGSSFASRVLLVLLLLIAGAALGIWAAPQIAPRLPSGMAPVANWLTPGAAEAEARMEALWTDVETEIAALRQEVAAAPEAPAEDVVAAAEARLEGQIAELRDQIGAVGGGTEFRERLAEIEAQVQGRDAEFTALREQIEGGAEGVQAEDVAARVDTYRAELEGLRGEFEALSNQVAGLEGRVEEVAASAERQVAAAETRVAEVEAEASEAMTGAETEADVALIRSALAGGQPFAEPVESLSGRGGAVPPELETVAESGVATMAQLRDSFPDAAHEAIRATIVAAAGDGFLARSRAFLEAQVASRSLRPQPGMTPDAVLSRMEDALRRDDLESALAESRNLPSEALAAMDSWLVEARQRFAAVTALDTLAAPAAPATN